MDELRFQLGEDCGKTFDRQMILRLARIKRRKSLLAQLAGKIAKLGRARTGRVNIQLPFVKPPSPKVITYFRIKKNCIHLGYHLNSNLELLSSGRRLGELVEQLMLSQSGYRRS
jgi:hypothetical protein